MTGGDLRYCRVRKIQLVTLGCSKNRVDSEHLLKQMESAGIEIVEPGYELSASSNLLRQSLRLWMQRSADM